MKLQAGFSQVDITPDRPLPLAGFAGRRIGVATLDPLYVKCVVLRKEQTIAALVCFDALWVSRRVSERLRDYANSALGMARESVMVSATHTHSSPQICEDPSGGWEVDPTHVDFAIEAACKALSQSFHATRPVQVWYGSAPLDIAVNRRKTIVDIEALLQGKFRRKNAMRPNAFGQTDPIVGVIRFQPECSGRPIFIVNAACHPTILREASYSADFPGRLGACLAQSEGIDADVLFLQGFSGDLRCDLRHKRPYRLWGPTAFLAALFDREQFLPAGSVDDVDKTARRLASAVSRASLVSLKEPALHWAQMQTHLPLDGNSPACVACMLQRIGLSQKLCLVGVEGEVLCGYAQWLRRKWLECGGELVLPVGEANGMIGYLPDAAALEQGGYEPGRSRTLFALPAPFSPQIERTLKSGFSAILTV